MKKKITLFYFELYNLIFSLLYGFSLHFLYDLTNKNILIGIISPVNESVWEHLKLIYFPTLFSIIIGSFYYRNKYSDYLKVKTIAIIYSLLFIIISFYTYSGILGFHLLFMDILIFIISCFIVFFYTLKNCNNVYFNHIFYIFILFLMFLLFLIFTFRPLNINLFK